MRRGGRRRKRGAAGRAAGGATALLLLLLGASCGRSLYSPPACSDGVDNDGDGLTDLGDPHCADPGDDDEGPAGDGGTDADADGDAGADADGDADVDGGADAEADGDVEPDGDGDVEPEVEADVDGGADVDDGGDDGDVFVPCEDGRPCTTMPVGRCVSGACASVWEGTEAGEQLGATVALEGALAATAPPIDPGHVLLGAPQAGGRAGRVVLADATLAELGTWTGAATLERFGSALAFGPDLGGADGLVAAIGVRPDVSLGAPGRVEIRSTAGPAFGLVHELTGPAAGALFGASVAWGPDADGDTVEDLAVGAPLHRPGSSTVGTATLYAGGDWTSLRSWSGSAGGDQFGAAVARGPAVRPGGAAVTLVGAPGTDDAFTDNGCAYLYEGTNDSHLWSSCGAGLYESFGAAVAAGVDTNGDGHGDFAVAGPGWNDGQGRVRLFAAAGELRSWAGAAVGDDFGWSIALGPDADGAAGGELLVGAPGAEGDRGRVYLLRHDTDAPLRSWDGEAAGDRFGCAVSLGGDVDGDGLGDVLVGACGTGSLPGKAYLFGSASW